MQIQLIRHASIIVNMGGKRILVDPMFSRAGLLAPTPNTANALPNPLVSLPFPESDVGHVDAVIVTHAHRDHLDEAAVAWLPKDLPLFCQPADSWKMGELGFSDVRAVDSAEGWDTIEILRTEGLHGSGEIAERMGPVSGFVLRAGAEPSLYIAGDTVWCPFVERVINDHNPDVVVVNGGAAQFVTGDPITMDAKDVAQVCNAAPDAKVIVVHMGAWNHCLLTRGALRDYLIRAGLVNRVTIPADGDIVDLTLN